MNVVRVLLVDASTGFTVAARKFLANLPRVEVVASATSAPQAIALAAALKPDLILMDAFMPGMNGLEATRLLKQHGDAPKIVILSLYNTPEYRAGAESAGADGFIAKDNLVLELAPLLASLFPAGKPMGRS